MVLQRNIFNRSWTTSQACFDRRCRPPPALSSGIHDGGIEHDMKTNHITCKTTDTLENLTVDVASSINTNPQDDEKNMSPLDHPRYKANPIYLIFECYIEDTIGHLPEVKSKTLQAVSYTHLTLPTIYSV